MSTELKPIDPVPNGSARSLSLLLEASTALSLSRTLEDVLGTLSQVMAESVGATFCRIYLLDDSESNLTIRGFHALRNVDLYPGVGQIFPASSLPWHGQAASKKDYLVVTPDHPENPVSQTEPPFTFRPDIRSVLLMPLVVKEHSLGVAELSEMRSWGRTQFTEDKIELCRALAWQGALAIENIRAFVAIADHHRQIQLILESVEDGVFSTDAEGRILVFNAAAERMTGYRASEMLGRRCSDKLRGQDELGCDLCGSRCPIQQILNSTIDPRSLERKEVITRRDGSKICIIHKVAPVRDQSNRVMGTVSAIRDISREEELIRLKSDFISFVSHQLRTPLTVIGTSAELLATSNLDEAIEKDLLRTLGEECRRLRELTNQVLESSRLEKGRIELNLEPLVLAPLLEEMVGRYRVLHQDHDFQLKFPAILPLALGDRSLVEVILDNLLRNAIKYSPAGSAITLSVEDRTDAVNVCVADAGTGIPADELGSIFLQYNRGMNKQNHKADGFGLGLYIAKTLVEQQGGRIWAESELGQGSRFCFTLEKFVDA